MSGVPVVSVVFLKFFIEKIKKSKIKNYFEKNKYVNCTAIFFESKLPTYFMVIKLLNIYI